MKKSSSGNEKLNKNLPSYMQPLQRRETARTKNMGYNRTVTQNIRDMKGGEKKD